MSVTLSWDRSGLTEGMLAAYTQKLLPELARMRAAKGYDDDRASINLPLDKNHVKLVRALAAKHRGTDLLIVIGIGGSNLGTMAVQEAVLGRLHNLTATPQVLYADTVDPDSIGAMDALLDRALKAKKRVVIDIVSKSGGTTETVANAEVLLRTLKRHRKDYASCVVVTTDEGSRLWEHAEREGFALLPLPKRVGGRYSVFSPVGLFPLALMGVDIAKLLAGAAAMRKRCLATKDNPAFVRAAALARAKEDGKTIADNFYFKTDLESVGKWYRQLMGESIGKEWDASRKRQVWMGITPTVSIGSTDLHSMAQLYFGGPKDKIHTIVDVKRWRTAVKLPSWKEYETLVPSIQGKELPRIMDAIVKGTCAVLASQGRPYMRITLDDTNAESIGALLQLHMMEMIYLAALLDVNPFDQPNVEAYKVETKKELSR